MTQLTVLAIDDEPINLSIIVDELEEAGYRVLTAENGVAGWEKLQQHKDEISAILLDRMMPQMDGMGFMRQLNADSEVRDIPVVMQTAAAQEEQVAQGIEAGVYYYLTKPYELDVLLAIVKAAIRDGRYRAYVKHQPPAFEEKLGRLRRAEFEIQTLEECQCLATFIANYFPQPGNAVLGICELLINAVEHGNLGIDYYMKSELLLKDRWRQEILTRLTDPVNAKKYVRVFFQQYSDYIELNIQDEGEGFEWQQYLHFMPSRMTEPNGRGIAIARRVSFDELEYNDKGNEVTARVRLHSVQRAVA